MTENEMKELIENEHKQYLEVRDKLEKQIDYNIELGIKIGKMKCCENCKHSYTDSENIVFCYLPILQENCKSCRIYNHKETDNDYWELAE